MRPDFKAEPWVPGLVVSLDGLISYVVSLGDDCLEEIEGSFIPSKVKERCWT